MKGFILIGITAIGAATYGIIKIFEKYAVLDIVSFIVIFLGLFGVYRLAVYALSKEGKSG